MPTNNFLSLATVVLTVLLVPTIVRRIPYFKKREVVARRLARAQLPPWILIFELSSFLISALLIGFLFSKSSIWLHNLIHPGLPYFSSGEVTASFNSLFNLIKIFSPFPVGVLLGALLGNFISWCVPIIRKTEYKVTQNVAGASFWEATLELAKTAAVIVPIAVILTLISVFRP